MTSITDPTTPTNEVCPPWCHAPHPAGDFHMSGIETTDLVCDPESTERPRQLAVSMYVLEEVGGVPLLHVEVEDVGGVDHPLDLDAVFELEDARDFRDAVIAAVDAFDAAIGAGALQ